MQKKIHANRMTREQLKETIKVNFELFKDDPEFYDYITTLVIYLMKYEYDDAIDAPAGMTPAEAGKVPAEPERFKQHVMLPGVKNDENCCKYCNATIRVNARICPYCLSMAS